jgi:hypothetical protein
MKLTTALHQQSRCYLSLHKHYVGLVETAAEVNVYVHESL